MQATNSFKSTLVVLAATLLVLSFAVQFIAGQACTSQAGLKPTTAAYFCPIGYVNTKVTDLVGGVTYECRKVNDMISPITKGKACRTAIDCMVTTQDDPNVYSTKLYSQCSNGRCVRASTRLPGDNCEWGSQCLGGRCDMSTKKCISSALYTAKQGDRCEVGFDGNTIYCESGTSQSLKCVPEVVTLGTQTNTFKFCYAKNTVTVGKTCTTTNNATKTYDTCEDFSRMFCNSTLGLCVEKLADGSFCNAHAQCKSGDCVRSDLTDPLSATCKTLKTAGATCQSALECTNSLTCRSTVAKASRVCTTPAALGDYCAADSDCFFNSGFTFGGSVISTELVVCANQRCVRQNGVINGQKCEKDANCHSGYCDISGGVCKVAPALTCDGKNTDGKCPSCACTSGENSAGVCLHNVATNCPGYLLDLQVCVYNNFVNSLTDPLISNYFLLARSNVDSPFLDTDSTLYKTCGPYYNNLMKCLYSGNLDKWTPAEIDGFSFTGTATPNVMLPKVISGAGSITSSLVMLALVVLSFLLF